MEDTETSKTSAIPNFMSQILPDDEISKGINSLNSKQREFVTVVNTWNQNYVKYDGYDVKPVRIFISGNGRTGKYHLVKAMTNPKSKTLLYNCKHPGKPRVLLLEPTGISALNIGGTTIHSCLAIKTGRTLLGLNVKSKASLRNRLSEVKLLRIDGLSMVSSDSWTYIDSRLRELFMMFPEKSFASLSEVTVAGMLQLLPVRGKLIFSQLSDKDSLKHLLRWQLWIYLNTQN